MDDEALTPVVGIILMVAVAVVLGAVVYVLVSESATSSQPPPSMAVQTQSAPEPLGSALDDDIATIEHRGGHGCVDLDDLRFQLKGTAGPVVVLAAEGDPAQWCPSDVLTLQEDGADVAPGAYVLQIVFTPRDTLIADALVVLS